MKLRMKHFWGSRKNPILGSVDEKPIPRSGLFKKRGWGVGGGGLEQFADLRGFL